MPSRRVRWIVETEDQSLQVLSKDEHGRVGLYVRNQYTNTIRLAPWQASRLIAQLQQRLAEKP